MDIKVAYGHSEKIAKLTGGRIVDIMQPKRGRVITELEHVITAALKKPLGQAPLKQRIKPTDKLVIIIDDQTRPTPTKIMLRPILALIKGQGVPAHHVTIIIATGAHKKLSHQEINELLGPEIVSTYRIENHDPIVKKGLVDLGKTSFGTPLLLNKKVYQADLRILTGMIKPHNQAGYSGGGKSILPGVCGLATILANHSYRYVSHPNSGLGLINGNPIRADIEEVLPKLGDTMMVNVVLNYQEEVIDLVVGDAIKAHRAGVRSLDKIARMGVAERSEICICGTPAPVDINFYQMLNSISAPYRVKDPVIKPGATIIVAGSACQGVSDGDFYEVMANTEREVIWQEVIKDDAKYSERAALQIYLEGEQKYRISVVSEEKHRQLFAKMGINYYPELQPALDETIKQYTDHGHHPNIIVLPAAPFVIPVLKRAIF